MNKIADIKQLVRKVLIETSAVTAKVSGNILTAHPRTAEGSSIPMPCVIVDFRQGGAGGYEGGHQVTPLDIYVYSRLSDGEADEVYHLVYTALQAARLYDGTLLAGGARAISAAGYIRETTRPDMGFNQGVQGWYARGQWMAYTAG